MSLLNNIHLRFFCCNNTPFPDSFSWSESSVVKNYSLGQLKSWQNFLYRPKFKWIFVLGRKEIGWIWEYATPVSDPTIITFIPSFLSLCIYILMFYSIFFDNVIKKYEFFFAYTIFVNEKFFFHHNFFFKT